MKTTDCLTWANIIVHAYHKSMLQGNKGNCSLKTLAQLAQLAATKDKLGNYFFFLEEVISNIMWSSFIQRKKALNCSIRMLLWWHY